MGPEIKILALTAASLGFVHTVTGPDHYLPFIVIGRARRWPRGRTLLVTVLCGIGHVLSSVVLGAIGIALGLAVGKLEWIEGTRGDLAAWLLISFGLVYAVWGWRQAHRSRTHQHAHRHAGGLVHDHEHDHHKDHAHVHDQEAKGSLTPWALFIIFVLGPCEPLIPLLMYPAARASTAGLILVTTVFAVTTVGTMTLLVFLADRGIRFLPLRPLERYTHALAGAAILASGLAIQFLGL